jgi:hypothetical protein
VQLRRNACLCQQGELFGSGQGCKGAGTRDYKYGREPSPDTEHSAYQTMKPDRRSSKKRKFLRDNVNEQILWVREFSLFELTGSLFSREPCYLLTLTSSSFLFPIPYTTLVDTLRRHSSKECILVVLTVSWRHLVHSALVFFCWFLRISPGFLLIATVFLRP